jgi:predicted nucleic acid-binding protein
VAVLIDTNVLLRGLQPLSPSLSIAAGAVDSLRQSGETMVLAVQNIIEFWAVATRPLKDNGLGLSVERAVREIAGFKELFEILLESAHILPEWERLVSEYRVSGKNAHDARLVAVMNVNRIDKILTFDTGDFKRFREIQVLDPRSLG